MKQVPNQYQVHVNDFLKLVATLSTDKADPTKLFKDTNGNMPMKCSLLTTKEKTSGTSGILWSNYQNIVYIPYFFSSVQKQGLGTELLRQIEKMFIAENYSSMVVFSTPPQQKFYLERGFASLAQPKLIGSSKIGQKILNKLNSSASGILNIFGTDAVILYKMCSETCFRGMLTSRGLDLKDLLTVHDESKISSLERRTNELDIR